jgi:hypothetical protein
VPFIVKDGQKYEMCQNNRQFFKYHPLFLHLPMSGQTGPSETDKKKEKIPAGDATFTLHVRL